MGATRLASGIKAKAISCIDIAFSRRETRRSKFAAVKRRSR